MRGGLEQGVVIADRVMPGMIGAQLARELRTQRSGLPVLIIFGNAEGDGVVPHVARLNKSYRDAELAESPAVLSRSEADRREPGNDA